MSVVKYVQELGYAYTTLTMTGEGNSQPVLGMIRAFDEGPKIINIESLSLRSNEGPTLPGNIRTVNMPFSLTVKAMFAELTELPPVSRTIWDVQPLRGPNVFLPLITEGLPENTDGLIEVERSSLQAILSTRAIIVDQNGVSHSLTEGKKVYLGYLTKIDNKKNRVEFTLNKGGIVEKFYLEMSFQSNE